MADRRNRQTIQTASRTMALDVISCVRTIIHESAHTAGISESGGSESYCTHITCDSGCGDGGGPGKGTYVADNWSAFVHCVSGQPRDRIPKP